jgi:hypothetical protein
MVSPSTSKFCQPYQVRRDSVGAGVVTTRGEFASAANGAAPVGCGAGSANTGWLTDKTASSEIPTAIRVMPRV